MKSGTALAFALFLFGLSARAQVASIGNSGRQGLAPVETGLSSSVAPIGLLAVLPSSIGINISAVHLTVSVDNPSIPSATIQVPVTSFWHLGSSSTSVELIGYFDSPQQALADAHGHWIPSDRVQGSLAGQQMRPFTETSSVGVAGATRAFYHQAISRDNLSASRSDVLEIRVDRIADLSLGSGVYQGVLRLRMVAY